MANCTYCPDIADVTIGCKTTDANEKQKKSYDCLTSKVIISINHTQIAGTAVLL